MKDDRIILPDSLQEDAIRLAHRGSHPQQCSMERRLRSHFFFHDMRSKVKNYLKSCFLCPTFSEKKTKIAIKSHKVPPNCWETVAVDLFGPMPSSKHVIVVQDLASRFPAAKLVSSTSSSKVLPALGNIYDAYGNPRKQISDNGPPFNSKEMTEFTTKRGIERQHIPPLHPSANPVETLMRPLGKAMKISHFTKTSDDGALQNFLSNYRDTPHPATGISPSSMMFRDGQEGVFPRVSVTDQEVVNARERDRETKEIREEQINRKKFRRPEVIVVGDIVLMRNHRKQRKFEPTFLPEAFKVLNVSGGGRFLVIERSSDGTVFRRHPDDVKKFEGRFPDNPNNQFSEEEEIREWHNRCAQYAAEVEEYDDDDNGVIDEEVRNSQPRRTVRTRHRNSRYFNDDFITD